MTKIKIKKQAIIFAGGKGLRLRPFTKVIPKPLLPVGDQSSLEILLKQLKRHNFNEIFLCVGYKADLIKSFFRKGEKIGIKIKYIFEKKPKGTIGALKLIKSLKDNFLVINADVVAGINFNLLIKDHIKNKKIITIVTKKIISRSKYGVLNIDKEKFVFKEKPKFYSNILVGIYIMNKDILKHIPGNSFFGVDTLIKKLIKNKIKINVHNFSGFWSDIGNEDDYYKVNKIFSSKKKLTVIFN
jgi:NDP-sugar pyrophosphorylase family protein